MSREQGAREAGMRPAANAAGRRRHGMSVLFGLTEAAGVIPGRTARRDSCPHYRQDVRR